MERDGQELPEGIHPECLIADTFSDLDQFTSLEHKHKVDSEKVPNAQPLEQQKDHELLYITASWLTKEGILSGTTATMDLQTKGPATFTYNQWGMVREGGVFVDHQVDKHIILYNCENLPDNKMKQTVRVAVTYDSLPKTEEEYQKFKQVAKEMITDKQRAWLEKNGGDAQVYDVDKQLAKVVQKEDCRYIGIN